MEFNQSIMSILAIIGTNVGLFLWLRTESRNDTRALHDEMRDLRKEQKNLQSERIEDFRILQAERKSDNQAIQTWTQSIVQSIQDQMKDFHGRLCAIEENKKR